MSVMDGETIVLGGLISKLNNRQENKMPWLGDLPYIGAAFRYRTQTQEKRELLVILTPHVIRNCADSERFLIEEARKMNWVLRDVDKMFGPPTKSARRTDTRMRCQATSAAAPLPPPTDSAWRPVHSAGQERATRRQCRSSRRCPRPEPMPPIPKPPNGSPIKPSGSFEPAPGIVAPSNVPNL